MREKVQDRARENARGVAADHLGRQVIGGETRGCFDNYCSLALKSAIVTTAPFPLRGEISTWNRPLPFIQESISNQSL